MPAHQTHRSRPWSEKALRHQALRLLKQCWLPVLTTMLLLALISGVGAITDRLFEQQAIASVPQLRPEPDKDTDAWIIYQFFDWYQYEADLSGLKQLWALPALAVKMLLGLPGSVLMLGLYRGLLRAVRGGACSVGDVFDGFRRGGFRAMGVYLLFIVAIMGGGLLAFLACMLFIDGIAAEVWVEVVMIGVGCRYVLAPLHLADDINECLSVSSCMHRSSKDLRMYGSWGLVVTMWPALLLYFAAVMVSMYLSGTGFLVAQLLILAGNAICLSCLVTIYEKLRTFTATPDLQEAPNAPLS